MNGEASSNADCSQLQYLRKVCQFLDQWKASGTYGPYDPYFAGVAQVTTRSTRDQMVVGSSPGRTTQPSILEW